MDKLNYFTVRQNVIGKTSNLLGTPLRAAILEAIAIDKSCFDNEFLLKHQVSLNILKKNVRALNKGGLIIRYAVGRNKANIYKINWERLKEFKVLFDELYYDIRVYQDKDITLGIKRR